MVTANILSPVIEKQVYNNNNFAEKIKTTYKKWHPHIYKPQYIEVQNRQNLPPENRLIYHDYDSYGNPVYVSKDEAIHIVYLWGYNHQYPIAEIKNATYSDVCKKTGAGNEANGKNALETIAGKVEPSATDFDNINALRTQLPEAMITTYTYKPLVGLQTVTDPRGVKTTYTYDPFGRLQAIKDENDKIIENYEYHYKIP
jgi:YD repeat-containing protein